MCKIKIVSSVWCENFGENLFRKNMDNFFQKNKLILRRLWRFEEQPFKGLPCPGSQHPVRRSGLTGRAINCRT